VNMDGQLVGINTAIFSKSGGSHGIGFAIPANMVRIVLDSARAGGASVKRPWFGASLQPVTGELAETLGLKRPVGALVSGLVVGGPAEAAGLRRLDVIMTVDGIPVDDPDGFGFRFTTKPIGGVVPLGVLRNGAQVDVLVRLIAAPETPPRNPVRITHAAPFRGLIAQNLSPATREEFSLQGAEAGIVISAVEPGSTAEQVGFQVSDVIIAINGQRVEDTEGFERLTRLRTALWRITFNRGGQVMTSAIGG
jgi:S1-C subfamily serine protease